MDIITFECRTITKIQMSGAKLKKYEMRASSIKGVMRFWWRACNGQLNLKQLKERENAIFGSTSNRSSFTINMITPQDELNNFVVKFTMTKQQVTCNQEVIFDLTCLKSLFEIVATLGGLGMDSRLGQGSFEIKKCIINDVDIIRHRKGVDLELLDEKIKIISGTDNLDHEYSDYNDVIEYYESLELIPSIRLIEILEVKPNVRPYSLLKDIEASILSVQKEDRKSYIKQGDPKLRSTIVFSVNRVGRSLQVIVSTINIVREREIKDKLYELALKNPSSSEKNILEKNEKEITQYKRKGRDIQQDIIEYLKGRIE